MAKKTAKKTRKKTASKRVVKAERGSPKFPYTSRPSSLRKLLSLIPNRPKPDKLNTPYLKANEMKSGEDSTVIRVIKSLGFADASGIPTERWVKFMNPSEGGQALGDAMKSTYEQLFRTHLSPCSVSDDELRSFFLTYGGSTSQVVVRQQVNTFKALCEFASFSAEAGGDNPSIPTSEKIDSTGGESPSPYSSSGVGPSVNIDLHIHLPQNKSSRDYENIIQDIARYIYRIEPDDE